ncbi:MAG: hypothetical protein PHY92_05160 [Alphaproteobacteria bacterium]|nr:hypothetical protein [Alphaproteobacteria bacterium]
MKNKPDKKWPFIACGSSAAAAIILLLAAGAQAKSGDMFTDQGMGPYNRPPVPSDRYVGPDLFPPAPVFIDPKADMFRRLRAPYDFGRSDMFVTHPGPVPYYPIFQYPEPKRNP